jgi:hypothetical protein
MHDDEFEATVFEEAPVAQLTDDRIDVDTSVNNEVAPLDDALASLDAASSDGGGSTSSERLIPPPPPPRGPDARDSGNWTSSGLVAPPPPASGGRNVAQIAQIGSDDWVVTNVAAAVRSLEAEAAAEPAMSAAVSSLDGNFVAGEIDIPGPAGRERQDTPSVEFTAASAILGTVEVEPDTGERRS